jgi:hypothetical protein
MELSFQTFQRNSAAPIQRLYALAITTVMGEWCAANGRAPGLQPRRPHGSKAPLQLRGRLQPIAPRTALIRARRLAMDTKKARREIPSRLAGWLLD